MDRSRVQPSSLSANPVHTLTPEHGVTTLMIAGWRLSIALPARAFSRLPNLGEEVATGCLGFQVEVSVGHSCDVDSCLAHWVLQ